MPIKLMYITNDIKIGRIIEKAGVNWIFVDLEYIGKNKRQANRNTVISAHTIDDVKNMRKVINKSQLLVRVNPIGEWSKKEIDDTIKAGADIIMLPYFKTKKEVEYFVELVNCRAKTCLLLETMEAIKNINSILEINGFDFIHIGLNDIHIQRKTHFMFEFLADGYVDILAEKFRDKEIPFGFGGMGKIGHLMPPAEHILAEHYRLGSSAVILSRSFMNFHNYHGDYENFKKDFIKEVQKIRSFENFLSTQDKEFFEKNRIITKKEIYQVVSYIKNEK